MGILRTDRVAGLGGANAIKGSTFFGTVGAIIFGMFAAQLVNQKFYGRTFMRSILLFPYVGPVVALAYMWTLLLDPNSGTLNALLVNFGIIDKPINLLGQK